MAAPNPGIALRALHAYLVIFVYCWYKKVVVPFIQFEIRAAIWAQPCPAGNNSSIDIHLHEIQENAYGRQ